MTTPQPPRSLINLTVDIGRRRHRHRPAIHPLPQRSRKGNSAELVKK
ncbi:MAG: hypothetical protein HC903_20075 [Methylacidiphilales bacterium]|nr:hypothetical protein [Candidatus Methylacidiphilales bacterium]